MAAEDPYLEASLARVRRDLVRTIAERDEALRQLTQATKRGDELGRQLRRAPGQLSLAIDGHVFNSRHNLRPELWQVLFEAGQLAFKFPSSSVAASRRAIERAVELLWIKATAKQGRAKVAEMLDELYGHPVMPASDWHLAKNLHGRASAIVHDGTERPDLALWIFFGAVQICELVQTDGVIDDSDPGGENAPG